MQPLKVLLVAEGSGGHLIPALQTGRILANRSVSATLWYAQRRPIADLTDSLIRQAEGDRLTVQPISVAAGTGQLGRLFACRRLWSMARDTFAAEKPDAVVGFGGWISAPVLLAACANRIPTVIHEQNVVMGKANRLLSRWVNRVAVSFRRTQKAGRFSCLVTGMPIREALGRLTRHQAAEQLGLDPLRPTLLVLGGSQGSRFINALVMRAAVQLSAEERRSWQIIHIAGASGIIAARAVLATSGVTAHVISFMRDMEVAFAAADLVVARSGASTVAELARCGLPSVLIPYAGASGHQRANAELVSACGGGIIMEEKNATPENLLKQLRLILGDDRLRQAMSRCVKSLDVPDAAEQLAEAILSVVPQSRRSLSKDARVTASLPDMAGVS